MMKNETLFTGARRNFLEDCGDIAVFLRSPETKVRKLYAPHERADHWATERSSFAIEPGNQFEGKLSTPELTAVLMIHNETRILARMLEMGKLAEVRDLLSLSLVDDCRDVIEGMSDFACYLSRAAGVRERLLAGGDRPSGDGAVDKCRIHWWDCFAEAVEDDDFLLGQAVCMKLVSAVDEKNMKGAGIAVDLYLATLAEYDRFFIAK